jgi:hypothetical protein
MKIRFLLLSTIIAMCAGGFASTTVRAETVFKVWHRSSQDLLHTFKRVGGLDVQFQIQGPTQVFVYGHVDVKHRCIDVPGFGMNYPIGIGMKLEHVDQTGTSRWVQGSKWGPNIASCDHHYVTIPLDGYMCLTAPGSHRISVWGTSHTTATQYDGVAEISGASDSDQAGGTNDPYNQMIVRVVPATSC